MPKIRISDFPPEDLRKPEDSDTLLIRIEPVRNCDGIVCGNSLILDGGDVVSTVLHDRHIVLSGDNPPVSPRYFAVPK
jgi:hypothetical protein